jgi:ankyrin repeat protein
MKKSLLVFALGLAVWSDCASGAMRFQRTPAENPFRGSDPIFNAIRGHKPEVIADLLKKPWAANASDWAGKRSLHIAAEVGNTKAVEMLLKAGAKLETKDGMGQTPLMTAAECGRAEIVRLLLTAGANRDARDDSGKTARELAGRNETIAELLK